MRREHFYLKALTDSWMVTIKKARCICIRLTLFLLNDVDRPDKEVDAVVAAVVVVPPLGEDVLVLAAVVGPERLALATPCHRRGVNVGLLVLILFPEIMT